ncbi:hypothetical protein WJX81_008204 [Elliptochloris bilobata]|uniref:Cilia- and flagella-associated protein 52 n=1 Tax=Elliptochloris bilobata TaxID=381761 RepID=A0AAW1S7N7_9CHLO
MHKAKVQGIAFSPCEEYLASVGGPDDNALVLWSVASGKAICGAAVPAASAVAFFSARSDCLVTCGRYSLLVWQVTNGKLAPLEVQLGPLQRCFTAVQIDESDEILYAATSSGDVATVALLRRLLRRTGPPPARHRGRNPKGAPGRGGPLSAAITLALAPGGGPLLVGGADGRVLVMPRDSLAVDTRAGTRLPILAETRLPGGVTSLALQAASGGGPGAAFLAGTEDGDVFRLQYDGGNGLAHERMRTAPQHALADVAFAPGYGGVFATCGGADVRLWATASLRELLRVREPGLACACVAFSTDGGALISGWSDGHVRAYGPQSGAPAYVIHDAHQAGVTALAPASAGGRLVTGGGDGTVRVWQVGSSQDLVASMKGQAAVAGLRLTEGDAECVSAGADGCCIIWDLQTFARRASLVGQAVSGVAYHPNESQLVTVGGGQVTYWDAADGQAIRVLDAPCRLAALAVHAGGELLATGGEDGVIRLLNYDEGDVRATCVGHNAAITRLCFAPEGAAGPLTPADPQSSAGSKTDPGRAEQGCKRADHAEGACLVSVDSQGCIMVWRVPRTLLQPRPA